MARAYRQTLEEVVSNLVAQLVDTPGPLDTPCRVWSGGVSRGGYALFKWQGVTRSVHKFLYEYFAGRPVAEGLVLDHLCRNRRCANFMHLEPVTQQVNILRGEGLAAQNAGVTHCPRGHQYDEENTYVLPSRPNARYCRECNRQKKRERRARQRGVS